MKERKNRKLTKKERERAWEWIMPKKHTNDMKKEDVMTLQMWTSGTFLVVGIIIGTLL